MSVGASCLHSMPMWTNRAPAFLTVLAPERNWLVAMTCTPSPSAGVRASMGDCAEICDAAAGCHVICWPVSGMPDPSAVPAPPATRISAVRMAAPIRAVFDGRIRLGNITSHPSTSGAAAPSDACAGPSFWCRPACRRLRRRPLSCFILLWTGCPEVSMGRWSSFTCRWPGKRLSPPSPTSVES